MMPAVIALLAAIGVFVVALFVLAIIFGAEAK